MINTVLIIKITIYSLTLKTYRLNNIASRLGVSLIARTDIIITLRPSLIHRLQITKLGNWN